MKCEMCNGTGKLLKGIDLPILDISPSLYEEVECHYCQGTGEYIPIEKRLQISNKSRMEEK